MRNRFLAGVAGVAGAAVLATGGVALATAQGGGGTTAPSAITAAPPDVGSHAFEIVDSTGDIPGLSAEDRERVAEIERKLDAEYEAILDANPDAKAEIERIEKELDAIFDGVGQGEPTEEQMQRADELMAQLDERFEQLRASDPERVERIEKLEGEIEEILPFEECGPEHDGPDDESPDGGDPETDGPATTPDVLPSS